VGKAALRGVPTIFVQDNGSCHDTSERSSKAARVVDWPHSSFHRDVERGLLAADWGGDMKEIQGVFGE